MWPFGKSPQARLKGAIDELKLKVPGATGGQMRRPFNARA